MVHLSHVSDVLRIRRHQPTRLEGFIDSSFAFAVTLVVISLGHVPSSVAEMLQALHGLPTFAVCFYLISRIWQTHRDWSRRYDIEDARSIFLSLTLVFLVLIYVYPLRLLFAATFSSFGVSWLSDGTIALHTYFELRAAYVVFGLGYAAIWAVFALLDRHALALRATIGLNAAEVMATQFHIALCVGFASTALVSSILALTLPLNANPLMPSVPGLVYFLMPIVAVTLRKRWLRRLEKLLNPPAA